MTTDTSVSMISTSTDLNDPWVPMHSREKLSIFTIIGITCALLGYQLAYSCNFSLITPIMGRLNFSNSLKPIIWTAAPITDLVVQPIVAFYSDQCNSKFGKRRPYILVGGLGTVIGFLLIFFCQDIGKLISLSHESLISQIIFVIAFVLMNIALNILQGPSRSLVGDIVPTNQQIVGNTIAIIMNGLGAIIVNLLGGLSLSSYTNLTNEQLVFIVGMISVSIAVFITLVCAREERYLGPKSNKSMLHQIYLSFRYAPTEVLRAATCFGLSWCGFFMFLVETTDFFGHMIFHGSSSSSAGAAYDRYTEGVNFGMCTLACVYTVSLLYGFVQPRVIDLIGAKVCFALSQFIEVVVLIVFNFVENKWVLFGLFSLLGMSFMAFNSIPFAIVAMGVPEEDMGKNMAVVNSCGCIGQQAANLLIGSGVSAIWPGKDNLQIASGAVFALLAGILTVRLIIPKPHPQTLLDTDALLTSREYED